MESRATEDAVAADSVNNQEIIFSLVMGFITVLNRDNPLLVYPEILWAFAALLGANLAYQLALRRSGEAARIALAATAANIVLVSAVLSVSGGSQSSFWPIYLLPIFTACLYLERRHVLMALAAAGAFLTCFYLEGIWERFPWQPCELAIKVGVLALAAAVMTPLAFKERAQRLSLRASREKIQKLALSLNQKTTADREAMKAESLRELAPRIAHDINNPLAVILGSVELMLQDAPEGSVRRDDLERIQSAARRCAQVTNDLFCHDTSDRAARALLREAQTL